MSIEVFLLFNGVGELTFAILCIVRVRARVLLTNSFLFLSVSLCNIKCTSTQKDPGSSENEFMDEEEE